jgi:hypothetical protein
MKRELMIWLLDALIQGMKHASAVLGEWVSPKLLSGLERLLFSGTRRCSC